MGDYEIHGSKRWHVAGMDEGSRAIHVMGGYSMNSTHLQPQLQIGPLFVE